MAVNPKSLDNLIPFVKGGDPRQNIGRPSKIPLLDEVLLRQYAIDENGYSKIHDVIESLHKMALAGDVPAIKEILDRTFGKSKQELSGSIEVVSRIIE